MGYLEINFNLLYNFNGPWNGEQIVKHYNLEYDGCKIWSKTCWKWKKKVEQ